MSSPLNDRRGSNWQEFERVYRETSLPVLRFLHRRLPVTYVEDACAEVYATAWRRWAELRGEPLPWLYGIARLTAANALRADERWRRLSEAAHQRVPVAPGQAAEAHALARLNACQALLTLREADREVLMLVAWEGLEPPEAAQVLGCSVPTFTVRLHRARRRLERAMAGGQNEDGSADPPTGRAATAVTATEEERS
ncbi:sigma-70 family RNA polymerase sigma factor [Streptomyces sp. 549]|uniref:RNA polymerase sigma factor n=1 Tax=Streptomyces sp. 549 TaxID=3049076 RepID=UPI0024C3FCB1|nr:sigma-70 family RNA polymerase sigma factor [Streptomyces sp. 549]MDK1474856.1 sigma-70 family RNA polymerase sigma factor [Streptomyces sp. 549]